MISVLVIAVVLILAFIGLAEIVKIIGMMIYRLLEDRVFCHFIGHDRLVGSMPAICWRCNTELCMERKDDVQWTFGKFIHFCVKVKGHIGEHQCYNKSCKWGIWKHE